jgi:hypothetical protein
LDNEQRLYQRLFLSILLLLRVAEPQRLLERKLQRLQPALTLSLRVLQLLLVALVVDLVLDHFQTFLERICLAELAQNSDRELERVRFRVDRQLGVSAPLPLLVELWELFVVSV